MASLRYLFKTISCLFLMGLLGISSTARAQRTPGNLLLPVYHLELDPADLDGLYGHVWSDDTVPATFHFGEETYSCRVRFRGGTSRNLPKKSWRIVFEDDDNVFGRKVLLLRAEYRDASLARNHLVLSLFRFLGHPAPETRHVNLIVNGEHFGVFLDAERLDDRFLARLGRSAGPLYKARGHASNFAPLMRYEAVPETWEKKEGPADVYQDVQTLLGQLMYWTPADFAEKIESVVDVDLALTYFAVELVVANEDGFTNNFFIYRNPEDGQFELIPWDNDATLGNNWRGEYESRLERFYAYTAPDHNLLLQRLMEYEPWRALFWEKVTAILNEGFDFLNLELEETYAAIRHDVAKDAHKGTTTTEFEAERQRILDFLDNRRIQLSTKGPYQRPDLSQLQVSNPLPTATEPDVVFQLTSPVPLSGIQVVYALDLNFEGAGEAFTTQTLDLFDDGQHDDDLAGDGIYGNRLTIEGGVGLVPFFVAQDHYKYPANGFSYSNRVPTTTYALRANASDPEAFAKLQWGNLYETGEDRHIELHNPTAEPVDVSHFYIEGRRYTDRFMLPPGTVAPAGVSLVLSTRKSQAEVLFTGQTVVGNLFFEIAMGDTLRMLSPALTPVMQGAAPRASSLPQQPEAVVINEINYHAADTQDAGDWLELYNPKATPVDLTGWYLLDQETRERFNFSKEQMIAGGGYAVVSRDTAAFSAVYPGIEVWGSFGFGLSNGGDHVQLFDDANLLVDEVAYEDVAPWPEAADGEGYTLELTNTTRDNSRPENWQASAVLGGTPGEENSVFVAQTDDGPGTANTFVLEPAYPNPFTHQVQIPYRLVVPGHVKMVVYDVLGRVVDELVDVRQNAGLHQVAWEAGARGRGIYFIVLTVDSQPAQAQPLIRH